MKLFFFITVFISPTLYAAQVNGVDIDSRQLGSDSFELVISNKQSTNVAVVLDALVPSAKKICGNKEARFGHYRFDMSKRINGAGNQPSQALTLTLEVRCGASANERLQAATPASQFQGSAEDQAEIERLTLKYLNDKDIGKYLNAYILLTNAMKQAVSSGSWQDAARDFNLKAGKVVNRQIVKVSWYNNSHASSNPGIYVSVDYVSQFDNISIHCGYLTWQQQKKGKYQLLQEEENYIDKATQAGMKQADIEKIKKQMGCVR